MFLSFKRIGPSIPFLSLHYPLERSLKFFFFFFFLLSLFFLLILHKLQNTLLKTLQILTNANITQDLLLTITLTLTNYNN